MEMPLWVWRVDFPGPGKLVHVGIVAGDSAWARTDQMSEGTFQGCSQIPCAAYALRGWVGPGFSSVPGPGVQGVSAHQAHQRGERLLQVGQVCEAGGESTVSDGLPSARCEPASAGVCSWGCSRRGAWSWPPESSVLCFLWRLRPNFRFSQLVASHSLSTYCVPGSILFPGTRE